MKEGERAARDGDDEEMNGGESGLQQSTGKTSPDGIANIADSKAAPYRSGSGDQGGNRFW